MQDLALVGDVAYDPGQELQGIQRLAASGRAGKPVGVVGDGAVFFVVLHAAERHGVGAQ
jgi:hypothetical protein